MERDLILQRLESIDGRVDQLDSKLETSLREMRSAFPGGDHEGHRRYHELMIQEIEERRRLRRAVQEKTVSGLIWAGLVGLGLAVWHYIVTQVRGP